MRPSTFANGNQRTRKNLMALRQQAPTDKAPRVALRIQGVMLSLAKHSVSDIARLLHVHRSAAHAWILAWNEHGITELYEGHRSGRPAALDEAAAERLRDIVESGPVATSRNISTPSRTSISWSGFCCPDFTAGAIAST